MIGQTVGSYRIVAQISVGGMGTVYRAEHSLIGRVAAVKVLHPEMSGNQDIVNRFFNEAKATTAIKHPGIVEIFDFGYMPSGHAFIVMEFLDGAPLSHRITERGTFSEPEAALLMRGVCNALAAAHAKGIVHRDLKPDNIFVVPDPDSPLGERTKILDFGIAKLTDVGLAGTATKTGAVMGTPTYMSPEQCSGRGQVDHRADLYSIGCMLYELLSGRPPFDNPGAGELIGSHLFVEPDPLSAHARVSPEMERLVMSLLAKRPEQRVQTALDLSQHLMQIAQQHGWVSHTTDPLGRFSAANIPAAMAPPGAPSFARPATGASNPTPMPTPAAPRMYTAPAHVEPPKPTTLSGAASQTHDIARPAKSRRGAVIAISAALAIAAGIVAFVAVGRGGGGDTVNSPKAASEPAPAGGTTAPPTASEPARVTAPMATTGTAPASGTATPTAPVTPIAPVTPTAPDATAPVTGTTPAAGTIKPATPTKTVAKTPVTKTATPVTKAATPVTKTSKPTTKTPKAKGGDLLETDIE